MTDIAKLDQRTEMHRAARAVQHNSAHLADLIEKRLVEVTAPYSDSSTSAETVAKATKVFWKARVDLAKIITTMRNELGS